MSALPSNSSGTASAAVDAALDAHGVNPVVRAYLDEVRALRALVVNDSSTDDYVALHTGGDAQNAIYTHTRYADIAMAPADAQRLSAVTGARVVPRQRTHYLHVTDELLDDDALRRHFLEAARVGIAWTSTRRGGSRTPSGAAAAAPGPRCPVHSLELPVSGVCDDCA